MEGRKQPAPPSPTPPSSSLVVDLFCEKNSPNPSPSLSHSVLPPPSTNIGKDSSSPDALGPSGKHEESQNRTRDAENVATVNMCPDGMSKIKAQKDKNPAYEHVKMNPCSLSSSLYYGGQDLYINPSSSHSRDNNDEKDDSNDPNAACRGNWWQGSLYY